MGVGPARRLPFPARQPDSALPLTWPTHSPHRAFLTPTPVITLPPPPGGPLDRALMPTPSAPGYILWARWTDFLPPAPRALLVTLRLLGHGFTSCSAGSCLTQQPCPGLCPLGVQLTKY